jgi:hypothetical protein
VLEWIRARGWRPFNTTSSLACCPSLPAGRVSRNRSPSALTSKPRPTMPGARTIVHFWDLIEEQNLYTRVRFEAGMPLSREERQRMLDAPDAPEGAEPYATVSVVHAFGGGVTLEWLIALIGEWDAALREHRRVALRGRSIRTVSKAAAETVH